MAELPNIKPINKPKQKQSWATWNVGLWVNNDYGLYRMAQDCINETRTKKEAAGRMLEVLQGLDLYETPDGAAYTKNRILQAMRGIDRTLPRPPKERGESR